MPFDRRRPQRREPGRRMGFRNFAEAEAGWVSENHEGACELVEFSDSGVALIAARRSAPDVGARLQLRVLGRPWTRVLEVVRIDPISSSSVLVAAQFDGR